MYSHWDLEHTANLRRFPITLPSRKAIQSSGMKSFDCSGFLWRVMLENGVLTKRTTARKYYMSLPRLAKPSAKSELGTVVFFDNLKHVGIVNDRDSFYHAQTHAGTNLSRFDAFWRQKVCGYRAVRK